MVIQGAKETLRKNRPIVYYESNYKQITNDMVNMLNLSTNEIMFDIQSFFINELKYSKLEKLGNDIMCYP